MKNLPEPKEVLTKDAYKVFVALKKLSFMKDFYLAGGTGLALRIGHRVSIDFDFFTDKNDLSLQHQNNILQRLRQESNFLIESQENGTLKVRLGNTLVSFFYYPYPLISSTVELEGITIASIEDIALMKIAATIGRGSKRDFIDFYFIIRNHLALKQLLTLGAKKYKDVRDFRVQALKALVYFDDAEKEKMPKMLKTVSWEKMKEFFKHVVTEEMHSTL